MKQIKLKQKHEKKNYKWGSMKFQMIKLNLAKRKGIPIDNFQMPKMVERRSNQMEMNGHLIMKNNPLIKSVDIQRKNTVNNTIAPSFRRKITRLNSQEIGVRRQITQKFKPNIKSQLKELNIEINEI